MNSSRRGFLRGMIAAAVAAQVPTVPAAQQANITEALTNHFATVYVDGRAIKVSIQEVGNGWLRVVGHFRTERKGFDLSLGTVPMGDSTRELPSGDYTYSMLIKPNPDSAIVAAPMLEHKPCATQYIGAGLEAAPHNLILNSAKMS